ncbi:hypothetical protein Ancab_028320 [Ancistrocladus abbreviatus]
MHLPLVMGGMQETQPLSWLPNNEAQQFILPDETNFLPQRFQTGLLVNLQGASQKTPLLYQRFMWPLSSKIGTLLVTASVQGHNINVFRIMPGHQGSSSASDVGNSYVHLYRLQHGLTNAVIQDISFSDDSHWIMISSSRGTNHLFAISPSGGPVNLQFADPSFKNSGLRDYSSPALQ